MTNLSVAQTKRPSRRNFRWLRPLRMRNLKGISVYLFNHHARAIVSFTIYLIVTFIKRYICFILGREWSVEVLLIQHVPKIFKKLNRYMQISSHLD